MAIEEDPTRGSEPAARLFAALLVNDPFCWTRITHKLRHREENFESSQMPSKSPVIPASSLSSTQQSTASSASRDLFLASLPYIFYSIHRCSKEQPIAGLVSRIARFNSIELRCHRPHRRCGPVAFRGEAALKPSRVVDCAP